jgi:hypothetical protein
VIIDRYKFSKEEVDVYKEGYSTDEAKLGDALIELARERTRIYAMPARWECYFLKDGSALVKRFRNSPRKIKVEVKEFIHV